MLCAGILLDGMYIGILEAFASPTSKPYLESPVFGFGELPVFHKENWAHTFVMPN